MIQKLNSNVNVGPFEKNKLQATLFHDAVIPSKLYVGRIP